MICFCEPSSQADYKPASNALRSRVIAAGYNPDTIIPSMHYHKELGHWVMVVTATKDSP